MTCQLILHLTVLILLCTILKVLLLSRLKSTILAISIPKALDATSKSATYDFKASYVRADASLAATAGYVKTNTAYTVTYQ